MGLLHKFLTASLLGVATVLAGCSTPPSKPLPPTIFVSEDGSLVLPAGSVILRDGHTPWTNVTDMLMMDEHTVSNLQARGYLP